MEGRLRINLPAGPSPQTPSTSSWNLSVDELTTIPRGHRHRSTLEQRPGRVLRSPANKPFVSRNARNFSDTNPCLAFRDRFQKGVASETSVKRINK